ncbi:hypothetical protein HD806DRAFT_523526 [Xylariaceae sp. AK1471]|nr:hypothetical protein HD806DRAFT_523526 [Xylariaceae sp. AK1471]
MRADIEKDNHSKTASDLQQHQHSNQNTSTTTTNKGTKDQAQDLTPPDASSNSQPIGAPISNAMLSSRRTPAILVAENQRQGRKLQKPLAPKKIPSRDPLSKKTSHQKARRAHGEIRPPLFYSSSAGNASVATRPLSEVPASTLSQPRLDVRGVQVSKPCNENEENQAEEHSAVVLNTSQQQPGSSYPGYISDDEISLPSVEELYRRLNPRGRISTTLDCRTSRTVATTNNKENKKRRRWGTPGVINEDTSMSFPTFIPKRRKLAVNYPRASLESASKPQGVCHDNQVSGRKRRWNNADSNPGLPPSPWSPKKRQDGTPAEMSSCPKNAKNAKKNQWRPIRNNTLQSTSNRSLHDSSSSSKSYTEPSVKAKTPFAVPEKHLSDVPLPSVERTSFSVAAHHNPPGKRKRSKSRKPARGRSL